MTSCLLWHKLLQVTLAGGGGSLGAEGKVAGARADHHLAVVCPTVLECNHDAIAVIAASQCEVDAHPGRHAKALQKLGCLLSRLPSLVNRSMHYHWYGIQVAGPDRQYKQIFCVLAVSLLYAGVLSQQELQEECVLPRIQRLPEVSGAVAAAVTQYLLARL